MIVLIALYFSLSSAAPNTWLPRSKYNAHFVFFFLVFGFYRIVPESVRWLLSRGKFARAETIVRIIASNNSLRLDPIWIREEMEEVGRVVVLQDPPKYPDIRILITHRAIRKNAFVLFFVWLVYDIYLYWNVVDTD